MVEHIDDTLKVNTFNGLNLNSTLQDYVDQIPEYKSKDGQKTFVVTFLAIP